MKTLGLRECTPNLPTKIMDFRGFDSGKILILRRGVLRGVASKFCSLKLSVRLFNKTYNW